jgi:restriction endonuclease S subunit
MRDGWVNTPLGEIVQLGKGGSWGQDDPDDGLIQAICLRGTDLAELIDGKVPAAPVRWIKESELKKSSCSKDMVLIETSGSKCGRSIVLTQEILNKFDLPVIYSNFCRTLSIDINRVTREFVEIWFSHHYANGLIPSYRATSAMPNLDVKALLRVEIMKVPPLPEQKRIVDLISSVDSYIEALQQQLESAKSSRGAVLHELLTVGGDDWIESTLGEIANWGSGGTPKADNPDFYDGEIPWCVIGDLTESEVWETEKRITNLGLSNSSAKVIDPGSVLLAMYGASIGRTGISAIPMATNQAIAFARCHPNLALPKYLLAYLQTQKTKFVEMGQGAAQPNISQTIIKSWSIDLPPIPYQNHLVSTMDVFDATLFTLHSSINSSKLLRSSLLSDLLNGGHEIPVSYEKVMGAA